MSRRTVPSVVYWFDDTLYLNITNRCTNRCYFCLRKLRMGIGEFNLVLENEPKKCEVERELRNALNKKLWKEIVFCGFGEPTTRLDTLLEVARWLGRIVQIPVRVDTNGHALLLFPGRCVGKELKEASIRKVSVSLNAADEVTYNAVCRPRLSNVFQKVLEFIVEARDAGLEVEITAVAIPEVEVSKVRKIAQDMKVDFRVRPYRACVW